MTKSPLPTPLVLTQNKRTTHPRIGLGLGSLLTPSKTASPLFFFFFFFFCGYTGLNTGDVRVQAGTFSQNHTDIYIYIYIYITYINSKCFPLLYKRELQARFRPQVALCKRIRIPGSKKLHYEPQGRFS